jgi:hypothetical protein
MRSSLIALLAAPLMVGPLMVGHANANDTPKGSTTTALPGVSTDYRIVKPLAPDSEIDPADSGYFRVGNMDVRVSGSITVDVGVGSRPSPRR